MEWEQQHSGSEVDLDVSLNQSSDFHPGGVGGCGRQRFPLRGDRPPALQEIAERHGATPEQVTLAWLLRRSPTMLPIPGTLSLEHLRQNLAVSEIELTDDEFEALH